MNTREASTSPDAERREQSLTRTGGRSQDTSHYQGAFWWLKALKRHPLRFTMHLITDRAVLGFILGWFLGGAFALEQFVKILQEAGL